MIFSGDTYVPLPTKELYDTQMMLAAVSAAKDMYDNAKNDYDKFIDKYSDFVSPVYGAADEYNKLTQGRMQNVVNNLYAQGIDPLRSSQGRAALQNAIRTTDYGKLNALKQLAKDYEAYQNARREMVAKGLTTDAFEDWNLRRLGLDKFTAMDGNNVRQWSRLTPSLLKSLSLITDDVYNKLVPTTSNGVTPDGKYNILSVSGNDRQQARIAGLDAVRKDPAYEFYKEMAGGSDEVLADMIERTNAKYLQDKLENNKEYEANLNLRNSMTLAGYQHRLEEQAKQNDQNRALEKIREQGKQARLTAAAKSQLPGGGRKNASTTGEYSAYNVNTDASSGYVEASVQNKVDENKGYLVGHSNSGAGLYMYKLPVKGGGSMLVVKDNEGHGSAGNKAGWYKSGNNHYRMPTGQELQKYAITSYVAKNQKEGKAVSNMTQNWFNMFGASLTLDFLKTAFNNLGIQDKQQDTSGGYALTGTALSNYLFDPGVVLANATGGVKMNKNFFIKDQNEMRKAMKEGTVKVTPTGIGGDVIIGKLGNKKSKYVECKINYKNDDGKDVTKKVLMKIGEYELDTDGTWIPTAKWAQIMMESDRRYSASIVGQKDAVDITTDDNTPFEFDYETWLQNNINSLSGYGIQ